MAAEHEGQRKPQSGDTGARTNPPAASEPGQPASLDAALRQRKLAQRAKARSAAPGTLSAPPKEPGTGDVDASIEARLQQAYDDALSAAKAIPPAGSMDIEALKDAIEAYARANRLRDGAGRDASDLVPQLHGDGDARKPGAAAMIERRFREYMKVLDERMKDPGANRAAVAEQWLRMQKFADSIGGMLSFSVDVVPMAITGGKVEIFFRQNSAEAEVDEKAKLSPVYHALQAPGIRVTVRIVGFASAEGSDNVNLRISNNRVKSVRKYLIDELHFPAEDILEASGVGEERTPQRSEHDGLSRPERESLRSRWRRVDVTFIPVREKK